MLIGRFGIMIPALALGGALAAKNVVPASLGTFRTDNTMFVGLTIGVIIIIGGLTFFPAVALGPLVEAVQPREVLAHRLHRAALPAPEASGGSSNGAARNRHINDADRARRNGQQSLPPPRDQTRITASPRPRSLFDPEILRQALVDSFKKLDPRVQVKNPVMFVVLVGTVVTFVESIANPSLFDWSITAWLVPDRDLCQFCRGHGRGPG